MAETPKQMCRRALACLRSDDLERARIAFAGLTPEQMDEQYGQSGKTRAEILAGYEEHAADVKRARHWLARQPD